MTSKIDVKLLHGRCQFLWSINYKNAVVVCTVLRYEPILYSSVSSRTFTDYDKVTR